MASEAQITVSIDETLRLELQRLQSEYEQMRTTLPGAALRGILDMVFEVARQNQDGELWHACQEVENWLDEWEIGEEPCGELHPEVQP